jgi:hypothetical protein
MVVADLDMQAIARRKLRMDSVGHYARPDIARMVVDPRPRRIVENTDLGGGAIANGQTSSADPNQDLNARLTGIEDTLRKLAFEQDGQG